MQYFRIAPGKFIEYDESTGLANILLKDNFIDQKRELQARIDTADPNQPSTNAQWVEWGDPVCGDRRGCGPAQGMADGGVCGDAVREVLLRGCAVHS